MHDREKERCESKDSCRSMGDQREAEGETRGRAWRGEEARAEREQNRTCKHDAVHIKFVCSFRDVIDA